MEESEMEEIFEEYVHDYGGLAISSIMAYRGDCGLSDKEFMTYWLSVMGVPEGEIAEALEISPGTVNGKKGRIRKKVERAKSLVSIVDDYGDV